MVILKRACIPKVGTEPAVGGAASTKISSNTIRLENILIAEIKNQQQNKGQFYFRFRMGQNGNQT